MLRLFSSKTKVHYRCKLHLVFWGIFGFVYSIYGTDLRSISFDNLSIEDGLSQISVLSIHQDHLNRMWFGTRDGLNCWDGVTIKQYFPAYVSKGADAGCRIKHIVQKGNYLWICSNSGRLSSFDMLTCKFKTYRLKNIRTLSKYKNRLLVASHNNIWEYNPAKDNFHLKDPFIKGPKSFSVMYLDRYKTLWISDILGKQIIGIDEDGKIEKVKLPKRTKSFILDLLVDSQNRLWIATQSHGVFVYNIKSKTFNVIDTKTSPYKLRSNFVRKIVEDKAGRVWLGTFNGLTVIDSKKNKCTHIGSWKRPPNGISHNSVHSLYISKDDNIWVGTYFGGVSYGRITNKVFTKYNQSNEAFRRSYPVIGPMLEDWEGNLWIGTEGQGIDYYDRRKDVFVKYPWLDKKGLPSRPNVKSLCLSPDGNLLIGTLTKGMSILNTNTQKFKHNIASDLKGIFAIIPFEDQYLLGTKKGVFIYNPINKSIEPLIKSKQVNKQKPWFSVKELFIDSQGILWLGTLKNGMASYDIRRKTLKMYPQDSLHVQGMVNCIFEDHLFRLWIGTNGNGLSLFDRETGSFTHYKKNQNGLLSNIIYGIKESRYGNIWVATSKGLSRFDIEQNLFYNYQCGSGLPLKELNYKALLQTRDGEMFIGGIHGLVSFNEGDLLLRKHQYKLIFSRLEVNNVEVKPNDNTRILSCDISRTSSITLSPNHTSFKLTYSACNYSKHLKIKYQYKLEGLDKKWVNAGYNTTVKYTSLRPGKYVFKVRGADMVNNPITRPKSIELIIKPPIFGTWYAYVVYAFLFLALILVINNFYLDKVRLVYQLRNEQEEKERLNELNRYKLRFFTDISHEFMTPLTIILSTIEYSLAKNKPVGETKRVFQQISRNAKRLKNLNRELLDFRKIEQGYLRLSVRENDIVAYLNEIFEAFKQIAVAKKANYLFEYTDDRISVWYDQEQLDKVFYNLLSNAFKYVSSPGGLVKIKLINNANNITVKVSNSGKVIPVKQINKIFNRFFQFEPQEDEGNYYGSGIGLALSQSIVKEHKGIITCESNPVEGTTFSVTLKKGYAHFNKESIFGGKEKRKFSVDEDLIMAETINVELENELSAYPISNKAPVILVVNENAEISSILQKMFAGKYRVQLAKDGKEGVEKIIKLRPDIIIAETKISQISGFELCKIVKRNSETNHIPLVLVTSLNNEQEQVRGFKCGADACITKPFNSDTIVARIDNLYNSRKMGPAVNENSLLNQLKQNIKNNADRIFIEKALKAIQKNISNPDYSVSDFAAELGISRTLFYQKTKSITGDTPKEFIQSIRLTKAGQLLMSDPLRNVSEVGYSVGFSSPQYFSKCFKQHFGVIPSKYGKKGE